MAAYKLSVDARNRLAEIYEYTLLNFGERQADAYYLALHETFERLAHSPLMGWTFRAYRRHDHGRYAIFYMPVDAEIVIAQIFHHSENIDARLR